MFFEFCCFVLFIFIAALIIFFVGYFFYLVFRKLRSVFISRKRN